MRGFRKTTKEARISALFLSTGLLILLGVGDGMEWVEGAFADSVPYHATRQETPVSKGISQTTTDQRSVDTRIVHVDGASVQSLRITSANPPEAMRANPVPPATSPAAWPSPSAQQTLGSSWPSGVRGRVATWPSCPVESDDQRCAPRPRAARVVFYRTSGQRVAIVDVGDNGRFELALAPGNYLIEAQAEGAMCTPANVTVTENRYVQVEINCDTGIR